MRYILLLAYVLHFSSCTDEAIPCNDPANPACPNYDPCLVFEFANADFSVTEQIAGPDCMDGRGDLNLVTEVDTTFTNQDLFFEALYNADTYEWHIGTDPRIFREKKFVLYFPYLSAPTDIDITLISCKQPPNNCTGVVCDTVSRRIHLFFSNGADSSSLVIGKFRGVDSDAPSDSFTIEIPPPLPTLKGIINFPNGCQGQYLDVSVGRKGFILFQTPTICQSACGIGHILEDHKTLVIDYSISVGGERRLKKFIGTKLN